MAFPVDLVGKTSLDYLVGNFCLVDLEGNFCLVDLAGNFCLVDLAVGIVGRVHQVGSMASMCGVADRAAAAENEKNLIRLQK